MRCLAGLVCGLLLWMNQCLAHPGRGIVGDADGNIYFADATRSVVWKVNDSGELSAAAREVHAHWIALDDAGRILADDVRYEGGRFARGLVRIDSRGHIEILIPHRPDPDGLDAGAFAPQGERIAIARDSRPVIEWLDPSRPLIGNPIKLDPGPTLNSLVAHAGGLIAIRGRQVLAFGVAGTEQTIAAVPTGPEDRLLDLRELWGLAVSDTGLIYTTDPGVRRVLSITPAGKVTEVAISAAPWFPTGVAWHDGKLLLLEHGLEGGRNLGPRVREWRGTGDAQVLATVDE